MNLLPKWCPHCGGTLDLEDYVVVFGGWVHDEKLLIVYLDGNPSKFVRLTGSENAMVSMMMRAHGRPVRKDGGLISAICANRPEVDWPEIKIVDVYICKIRRKTRAIGLPEFIGTSWGQGYFIIDLIKKETAA
jgi:DNA-binding response OmpR family regulator